MQFPLFSSGEISCKTNFVFELIVSVIVLLSFAQCFSVDIERKELLKSQGT